MNFVLTNDEIYGLYENLSQVTRVSANFPVRAGFSIIKNIKTLTPIFESIIEAKNQIVSAVDLNTEEGVKEAEEKINELSAFINEVNLEVISLKDLEHLELPLQVINAIMIILAKD